MRAPAPSCLAPVPAPAPVTARTIVSTSARSAGLRRRVLAAASRTTVPAWSARVPRATRPARGRLPLHALAVCGPTASAGTGATSKRGVRPTAPGAVVVTSTARASSACSAEAAAADASVGVRRAGLKAVMPCGVRSTARIRACKAVRRRRAGCVRSPGPATACPHRSLALRCALPATSTATRGAAASLARTRARALWALAAGQAVSGARSTGAGAETVRVAEPG